jgi:ribosomal protein S18 acetylase RimI-like enzyme
MKINVRAIRVSEISVLDTFLYHAVFRPPGLSPFPKEIIREPDIAVYIENFGKPDDCCVVAEMDGLIVGAAWTRIIPAFGHIDDETPELAISVLPEHRGKGIGTTMLSALFTALRKRGYLRTSLSVQKENPAAHLYQRLGYKIISANEEDYLMVKDLCGDDSAG